MNTAEDLESHPYFCRHGMFVDLIYPVLKTVCISDGVIARTNKEIYVSKGLNADVAGSGRSHRACAIGNNELYTVGAHSRRTISVGNLHANFPFKYSQSCGLTAPRRILGTHQALFWKSA